MGVRKMTDEQYDINWTCDWLENRASDSMFTKEFQDRMKLVTDCARKYVAIKNTLGIKEVKV